MVTCLFIDALVIVAFVFVAVARQYITLSMPTRLFDARLHSNSHLKFHVSPVSV